MVCLVGGLLIWWAATLQIRVHSFIKNVSFWAQLYFHFNLIISLRICNSLYYCCCSGWTFCGSCTWYHVGCMVLFRSVFFLPYGNFNYSIHSIFFIFYLETKKEFSKILVVAHAISVRAVVDWVWPFFFFFDVTNCTFSSVRLFNNSVFGMPCLWTLLRRRQRNLMMEIILVAL